MKWLNQIFRRFPLQLQIFSLGLLLAIPPIVFNVYQYRVQDISGDLFGLLLFSYLLWAGLLLFGLWRVCHEPFYTLANSVRSLHQGDYSQRLVTYSKRHAIGYLHDEINTLAEELQNNRIAAIESNRRFQYLIDQVEIGVIAFDGNGMATMVNAYLAHLYNESANHLVGNSIDELNLQALDESVTGRTIWLEFPEKSSRFLIHRSAFREDGKPKNLYLLTDVKTPLREEERLAWKRLIRVLGHELNNSLTPIISLSQSLKNRFEKMEIDVDKKESTLDALDVISSRANGMNRFVDNYAKLAKLPEPDRRPIDLKECVEKVVKLMRLPEIQLREGPECTLIVDPIQLEQLLINVIKNAHESLTDDSGVVVISWERASTDAVLWIDDDGPGIDKEENLFVPFFSTKSEGSGIGLVLCRHIAEANGGSIELANRPEGGCRATVRLPLQVI